MKNNKRDLILDAVLSLAEKRDSHANIKVSDIALEAGIGKGTVYEYFSSRDEIITNAVERCLALALDEAGAIVGSDMCFRDKVYKLLGFTEEKLRKSSAILELIINGGDSSLFVDMLKNSGKPCCHSSFIEAHIKNILVQGRKEGVISNEVSDEFALHAFQTVFSGSVFCMKHRLMFADENKKKAYFDESYELLIKALK